MANHTLENEYLKVVVSEHGAEMQSIFNKKNLQEYLWQGEKEIWGRRAPVLFPIVGRLYNDTYLHEKNTYKLGQHGFARDKRFELLISGERQIVFLLTEDDDTLKQYPFPFNLYITYTIDKSSVTISYEVQNTGEKDLLFSIGGHPGFNCPINKDEKYEEYQLIFERDEYVLSPLKGNFQLGLSEPLHVIGNKLKLTTSLFDNDAMIFKQAQIKQITLSDKNNAKAVKFNTDMPYFGIWSPKGTNKFVCLEPWNGIADAEGSKELKQKEGIIVLGNGQIHKSGFEITII